MLRLYEKNIAFTIKCYLLPPLLELPPPPPLLRDAPPPPLDIELPELLEGVTDEPELRVAGLDGCVVVGLVVLVVPDRDVPVVGRVVALVLLPVASLLVELRVVRVPTPVGLVARVVVPLVTLPWVVRVRVVFPTVERSDVRAAERPVTIRPFLSRETRELATRDVFPTRVLYPPRAARRVGAFPGLIV